MAHYALLDKNNTVIQVIVGTDETHDDTDWEQFYAMQTGYYCKRTSYNTAGGVHLQGGTPFRKNFAAPGYRYDKKIDAFIPPTPYENWILDLASCTWTPPVPYPTDGVMYYWDQSNNRWIQQDYRA